MEEKYSLFCDDMPILENATEKEFIEFLDELKMDYGYDPTGEYYYFYNNHYWYEKNFSF